MTPYKNKADKAAQMRRYRKTEKENHEALKKRVAELEAKQ
jgi:hypothetical protein